MLLNNRSTNHAQKELIEDLEGLGDILVFLTESKRNFEVLPSLKEFGDLLNQLLELRKTNPEKFEKLMLAEEYWKILQVDEKEAQLRLHFAPDKYLVTFSHLLNQIIRVFETALKVKNEEVSRHACYELVTFLARLSEIENAEIFVREILKKLLEFSRRSIELNSTAAHASTYDWYITIVFNKSEQQKEFRYGEYLGIFNDFFRENIKYLITHNHLPIYKRLVGSLVESVHVSTHAISKLWDYLDLLSNQNMAEYRRLNEGKNITKNISWLDEGFKKLFTSSQLQEWLTRFEEYKNLIYPVLNNENQTKADSFEKEIRAAAIQCYANQSLMRLMFFAGAWAVYKNEPMFINEIWTFKQPDDAGASYGGNDIYPQSLKEAIEFYFLSSIDDDVFFWDDHHDGGMYVSQYFLLLIMKYLKNIQPDPVTDPEQQTTERYGVIEAFQLPFDNSSKLSDIKFQVEGLLATAKGLKKSPMLEKLGLINDETEINTLIEGKLIPFLNRLISNAEEKITRIQILQPLSDTTIQKFKEDVYESFTKSATIRKLLANKSLFENKVSEGIIVPQPIVQYNEVRPRDLFLEEWHVDHSDWGKHYGRSLGEEEDASIVNSILEELPKTTNLMLDEVLSQMEITDDTIIFASYDYLYDYLEKTGHFKPYWSEANTKEREPNFQGWYTFGERKLKIYNYHVKRTELYYAVFNLNNVGKLVQYYPLFETDESEALYKNLRIIIKDISKDEEFVSKLLREPPPWLQKQGDAERQKLFLSQHITLQVGEKFEFIKAEDPKGISYLQTTT